MKRIGVVCGPRGSVGLVGERPIFRALVWGVGPRAFGGRGALQGGGGVGIILQETHLRNRGSKREANCVAMCGRWNWRRRAAPCELSRFGQRKGAAFSQKRVGERAYISGSLVGVGGPRSWSVTNSRRPQPAGQQKRASAFFIAEAQGRRIFNAPTRDPPWVHTSSMMCAQIEMKENETRALVRPPAVE